MPQQTPTTRRSPARSDVLIVGAGPAGLSLAISLAGAGFTATVLDQQPEAALADPAPDGREIALTHPSGDTLRRLGSWQHLAPHEIGRIREAQVHDGPVGLRSALELDAVGSGCDHLGWRPRCWWPRTAASRPRGGSWASAPA